MSERFTLTQNFHFEAAHRLPNLPPEHKCSRLHGHSFRLTVDLEGQLNPHLGWVMDYAAVRQAVQPILEKHLDHYYLNEVPGLENPTSENLARFLWEQIKPKLPGLIEITIAETCETSCRYQG